jgi:hypothetical protein
LFLIRVSATIYPFSIRTGESKLKINNPFSENAFYIKHKRLVIALTLLAVCLLVSSGSYAAASYLGLVSNISIPDPLQHPALTYTFTFTAKLNGTAVSDPTNIAIPSGFYAGDSYTVIYKLTNTANQPLLITPQTTGVPCSFDKSSITLQIGATSPLTLTIPNIQSAGSIAVSFEPSSAT